MNSGLAQLGDVTFRINPQEVSWNFQVFTNPIKTIGGRVVQVTGAALSDINIRGQYGEDHPLSVVWYQSNPRTNTDGDKSPGRSWRLAEDFTLEIRRLMVQSSPPPTAKGTYQRPTPMRFYYPARGWDFQVFVKSVQDDRGGNAVSHQTGKFSYGYVLTLVPVGDNTLQLAGKDAAKLQLMKDKAVSTAIARISDGMGWKQTKFNSPDQTETIQDLTQTAPPGTPQTAKATVDQKIVAAQTAKQMRLTSG
jgi:hypothetical protein